MLCDMLNLEASCLERAWPVICQLIGLLQVFVPRLAPGAAASRHWQHLTRVAESLVRRWLVLKACQAPWPKARVGQRGGRVPSSVIPEASRKRSCPGPSSIKNGVRGAGSRISAFALSGMTRERALAPSGMTGKRAGVGSEMTGKKQPRRPHFRLTEPEPVMPVLIYHPAAAGQPGYYVLGRVSGGGALNLPRRFNPENLTRRCAALQAVLADPAAHTLRMARWLARAADRCRQQAGRRHPFGVGRPPGASRRQRRHDPERQNLLNYLNEMARDGVARYAGT